jgi:hypothetical protein
MEVAMRFTILILALSLSMVGPTMSADGPLPLPPVLYRIENPEKLTVLAIERSGERAVGAMAEGENSRRSSIMFYSTAQAEVIAVEVPAQVRALLLSRQDSSALALLHRSAKRGEGETYLAHVDPIAVNAKRLLRLPPSAVDLDYWPARSALLVACRNEIRTLLLPEMRSGPLYRIIGNNHAVAALAGTNLILVGQDAGLLLVDLDATHGKEEMPVRGEFPLPQPVHSISAAEDGSYALVTMSDDSIQTVNIAALMPSEPPAPAPEPVVVQQVVEEPIPAPEPAPEPQPIVIAEPPEPAKAPVQVRGKITGADLTVVVALVLFGPNNMLREAARIVPESDGSWSISGLETGKYRVQLDGGGRRVLVTDPPFLLIDIEQAGVAEAGEIRLLKAL